MNQTVWKFTLSGDWRSVVKMPIGAKVLSAGVENGDQIVLWALCYPDVPKESRGFWLLTTGTDLYHSDVGEFVATVEVKKLNSQGVVQRLVCHIFSEKTRP